MVKAIRGTAILGCPYMVIHSIMPFGDDKDPDPERLWSMNYEFMGRLADAGREYGVIVCHENMPMLALSNSTPEAILKFVRTLNHPNFKICLDTGHCAVFGLSVGDAVRMTGKELLRVLHVHDNDGHGDRHWLPYTGVIDWDDFSNALEEIGFERLPVAGNAHSEQCAGRCRARGGGEQAVSGCQAAGKALRRRGSVPSYHERNT
ncbi:MAG: sugar phosphate isomerase/epimerase [Oscillospiraceae bacterium]|nr:MAG: sugar phosphate isomerase/epimerase [Oscillospiraceae bacterium]